MGSRTGSLHVAHRVSTAEAGNRCRTPGPREAVSFPWERNASPAVHAFDISFPFLGTHGRGPVKAVDPASPATGPAARVPGSAGRFRSTREHCGLAGPVGPWGILELLLPGSVFSKTRLSAEASLSLFAPRSDFLRSCPFLQNGGPPPPSSLHSPLKFHRTSPRFLFSWCLSIRRSSRNRVSVFPCS